MLLDLARIFHTDRDEEAAKADGARRAMKSDDGCVYTHCPRKTSRSTQHPSNFPASAVDRDEIFGLGLFLKFHVLTIFCLSFNEFVMKRQVRNAQQSTLVSKTKMRMVFFEQLDTSAYRPSCLDFFMTKSNSMVNCPIFEWSFSRSASKSSPRHFFPTRSKASGRLSYNFLFHSET